MGVAFERYIAKLQSEIEEVSNITKPQDSNGWNQIRELVVQLNGQIPQLADEWHNFQRSVQSEFGKWSDKAMEDWGWDKTDPDDTEFFRLTCGRPSRSSRSIDTEKDITLSHFALPTVVWATMLLR